MGAAIFKRKSFWSLISSDIASKDSYRISRVRILMHTMVRLEQLLRWYGTGCVWRWIRSWSKRRAAMQSTEGMKHSDCSYPQFAQNSIGITITCRFQTSLGRFMIGLPNTPSHNAACDAAAYLISDLENRVIKRRLLGNDNRQAILTRLLGNPTARQQPGLGVILKRISTEGAACD